MSGELEFKRLADVELLEKAPEGATTFAEVNGEVKRVAGGIGGGSGYVWDLTPYLEAGTFEASETLLTIEAIIPIEEATALIDAFVKAGQVRMLARISDADGTSLTWSQIGSVMGFQNGNTRCAVVYDSVALLSYEGAYGLVVVEGNGAMVDAKFPLEVF